MTDYPESEKLQGVSEESQKIGFFLEWLKNRYALCKWQDSYKEPYGEGSDDYILVPEGYYPDWKSIQDILAEYFEIDMKKVNEERTQILEDIRNMNKI